MRFWERILVVLGVCLPVPLLAATGLSVPLPASVERIAAGLVPFAEAAVAAESTASQARVGRIVLSAPERAASRALQIAAMAAPSAKPGAVKRERPAAKRAGAVDARPVPRRGPTPSAPSRVYRPPVDEGGPEEPRATAPDPTGEGPAPEPKPEQRPQPPPPPQPRPEPSPEPSPEPEPAPAPPPLVPTVPIEPVDVPELPVEPPKDEKPPKPEKPDKIKPPKKI